MSKKVKDVLGILLNKEVDFDTLCTELERFEMGEFDGKKKVAMKLLDKCKKFQPSDKIKDYMDEYDKLDRIRKASKKLLDYFFEIEDVESCEALMRFRNGNMHKKGVFEERKKKYAEFLKQGDESYDSRVKLAQSEADSEYKYDLIRLMELYGKLDAKQTPENFQGIYKSDRFKDSMICAIVGEYGAYMYHLYRGMGEFDRENYVKECLEYWHDKEYEKYTESQSQM